MNEEIDWDDPAARFRLIERVGVEEYNRLHEQQIAKETFDLGNGWQGRWFNTRWGRVLSVLGTQLGFSTLEAAQAWCKENAKCEA